MLISSPEEWNQVMEKAGGRLVVVDFFAKWCGPCVRIAPEMERLEEEYGGRIVVRKVDVDQSDEIATHFKVSSMPTFLYFKNGVMVDKSIGAVMEVIREKIEKHM